MKWIKTYFLFKNVKYFKTSQILGDFEIFRETIDKSFNRDKIIEKINKLNNDGEILICQIYRMKMNINIKRLIKKYLK